MTGVDALQYLQLLISGLFGADTTDIQWASAAELVNGSLLLKCGFAEGSTARGCQLTLHLHQDGKVKVVVDLLRRSSSREVWELYEGAVEWGVNPYLTASDIEEDGSTGGRDVEGGVFLINTLSGG